MNETHSVESDALRLAEESFRHSWDMSDERLIDGAWVAGLCCECGDFVPYGGEVAHVAAALAHLIDRAKAEAWDDGHDCCSYPICRANPYRVTSPADGRDPVAEFITAERALHADGCLYPEDDCTCETPGSGRA